MPGLSIAVSARFDWQYLLQINDVSTPIEFTIPRELIRRRIYAAGYASSGAFVNLNGSVRVELLLDGSNQGTFDVRYQDDAGGSKTFVNPFVGSTNAEATSDAVAITTDTGGGALVRISPQHVLVEANKIRLTPRFGAGSPATSLFLACYSEYPI